MFMQPDNIDGGSKNGFKIAFETYDQEHLRRHINTHQHRCWWSALPAPQNRTGASFLRQIHLVVSRIHEIIFPNNPVLFA